MSGYAGPDDESLHAIILSENAIHASQELLKGNILTECLDCGEEIDPRRVKYAREKNMKCEFCVSCQERHDTRPQIRMLDHIL